MFVCLTELTSQHGGPHLTKRQSSLNSRHSNQVKKGEPGSACSTAVPSSRSSEVESRSGNLGRKFLWVAVDYVRVIMEETGL